MFVEIRLFLTKATFCVEQNKVSREQHRRIWGYIFG